MENYHILQMLLCPVTLCSHNHKEANCQRTAASKKLLLIPHKEQKLSVLRSRCGIHVTAFLIQWIIIEIIKSINYWLKILNIKIFLVQREKHVLAILKSYRVITNSLRIHRGFKSKYFMITFFFHLILAFKEQVLLDLPCS